MRILKFNESRIDYEFIKRAFSIITDYKLINLSNNQISIEIPRSPFDNKGIMSCKSTIEYYDNLKICG